MKEVQHRAPRQAGSTAAVAPHLRLEHFIDDDPWGHNEPQALASGQGLIDGVTVTPFVRRMDERGELIELLTERDGPIIPIGHVYQVFAEPGSIRAWNYHKRQSDRLAYTNGSFRVVLFDLREGSNTRGNVNELDVGAANPCLITLPRFVVHGVKNTGDTVATFVSMPTTVYNPARPDKSRLPYGHPDIPYRFE